LAPPTPPSLAFIPSAIVYVSFNIVCSIPLLAPVGKEAPDKRSIRIGTALAALVLTLIALFILLSLSGREALAENDLPMLALAEALSPALGILYACLLFGGIFSTGFSTMTALGSYCTDRFGLNRLKTALVLGVLSLLGMLIARSGFRELVGFFYPVFGYLGLVPLLLLFLHALIRRFKKGNKRNKDEESGQEFSGNQENTQV
ncbi:MAG: hypothetical protein IKD28_00525, partial [Clostridia bacterium]|nr:hypothetical protein [Clostridia bacterium]